MDTGFNCPLLLCAQSNDAPFYSKPVDHSSVTIFVVQLVVIRNETKSIIADNQELTRQLQSFLESELLKQARRPLEALQANQLPTQLPQLPELSKLPPAPPQPPSNGHLPNSFNPGGLGGGSPGFVLPQGGGQQPQILPNSALRFDAFSARKHPDDGIKWLTSRYFGITANAGLGNQLFELVSVLGIASSLNRTAFVNVAQHDLMGLLVQKLYSKYPELLDQFTYRFDMDGSYPVQFNNPLCCKYDNVSRLLPAKVHHSIMLDGVWFQSYKYFHHLRKKVREWITPLPFVQQTAKQLVPPEVLKTRIICVHTRRGDFVTDNYHKPSDEAFTLSATQFLVKKNLRARKATSVVVMGNDPIWSGLLFMGMKVYPLVNSLPEQDLSFSQQYCDEVLTTAPSSTFGFWLAYLAKDGAAVYFRDIYESQEKVIREFNPDDFFPKEWTRLKFTNGTVYVG